MKLTVGGAYPHDFLRTRTHFVFVAAILVSIALTSSCSQGSSTHAPKLVPTVLNTATVDDLGREFSKLVMGTYRIKYQAVIKNGQGQQVARGVMVESKDGLNRQAVRLGADLSDPQMGDATVIVDGASTVVCYTKAQLHPGRIEPGCYSGAAAPEAAAILVSLVGLPVRFSAGDAKTDGLAIVQASTSFLLDHSNACYRFGSVKDSRAEPIDICFSDSGAPLYRRFPVGGNSVELTAVESGLPSPADFVPPYPVQTGSVMPRSDFSKRR